MFVQILNFMKINLIHMGNYRGIHSLKNNIALENRLLFLRIGLSIVGTLILLFLMIFLFGRTLQTKAAPSEPTSAVIEVTSMKSGCVLNIHQMKS